MIKINTGRRWSDKNYHWLNFTYSHSVSHTPFFITLRSAEERVRRTLGSCEYDGCNLMFGFGGHTLIIELPEIIKPEQKVIYPAFWSDKVIKQMGRNWYIKYTRKEYGFSIDKDSIHLSYGIQPDSSNESKNKVIFYPWKETRIIRQSYYHGDGTLAGDVLNYHRKGKYKNKSFYSDCQQIEDLTEKIRFKVKDADGTVVDVKAYICEEEYSYGVGHFEWLSWFTEPIIKRSLIVNFDSEVGNEKGSWKGGLMGTSIIMQPGEQPEKAFKRFIEDSKKDSGRNKLNLTYLGIKPHVKRSPKSAAQ
jgi:hypothetical protein